MTGWAATLAIAAAWLLGGFGGGALLAALYRRLYPSLSFNKLVALWTMVLSGAAALILALT